MMTNSKKNGSVVGRGKEGTLGGEALGGGGRDKGGGWGGWGYGH